MEDLNPVQQFNLISAENSQQSFENVDQSENNNNQHFYINKILFDEDQQVIGYNWIYQYDNYQIKLEYKKSKGLWKIIDYNDVDQNQQNLFQILNHYINYMNNLSLEEQIQIIDQKFDEYFSELKEREKRNDLILHEEEQDNEIINVNRRSNLFLLDNHLSTPSTIIEVDEEPIDFASNQLLTPDYNPKLDRLTPPVSPFKMRLDSTSSSTNSIKYAQFVPPVTSPARRRRIIKSIVLSVQRKKKMFESLTGTFKHSSKKATINELGLEFLRIYDGKFNYPIGHTFIISFAKQTWFLTLQNIECIECQFGEKEPRSILILEYKNTFTNVQV